MLMNRLCERPINVRVCTKHFEIKYYMDIELSDLNVVLFIIPLPFHLCSDRYYAK